MDLHARLAAHAAQDDAYDSTLPTKVRPQGRGDSRVASRTTTFFWYAYAGPCLHAHRARSCCLDEHGGRGIFEGHTAPLQACVLHYDSLFRPPIRTILLAARSSACAHTYIQKLYRVHACGSCAVLCCDAVPGPGLCMCPAWRSFPSAGHCY